jgi:5-formyltetrahydrofolate cyclo-ligase
MMVPPTYDTESRTSRAALRSDARIRRKTAALSAVARVTWPSELVQTLSERSCIAGYWPLGSEISVVALLETLDASGISICFPYFAHRDAEMQFRHWDRYVALEASPFDFAQPSPFCPEVEPDCLLVPLLAFDRFGNRIGQGGGHYDRYFARYPNSLRIGVAWWQQERSDVRPQQWDVKMHIIATDREWIDLREGQK